MGTTKQTWGKYKGKDLRELSTILGGSGSALTFMTAWCDICKRLNPTAQNIDRQNDCLDRYKRTLCERPRN